MKPLLALILLSMALLSPAFAATDEEATELYTDTGAPGSDPHLPSGFHGLAGAGLFVGQRIIGDEGAQAAPLPFIFMTYKDIAYWNLGGGGVWLFQSDDHALRLGAGIRVQRGWKAGDDAELAGMNERKTSLDGYVNGVWRTPVVTVGVRYYHDLGSASRSDAASLRFSRTFMAGDSLFLTPSIGAVWQAGERVDYYYGVHWDEALFFRPAYDGKRTVNANAGMGGAYLLSRSWSLLGGVFLTRYGDGIVDSPIVTRRYSTLGYFGAAWRF